MKRMEARPKPRLRLTIIELKVLAEAARIASDTGELRLKEIADGDQIFLSDVTTDLQRFLAQIAALDRIERPCPMIELGPGNNAPADLLSAFQTPHAGVSGLSELSDSDIKSIVDSAPETFASAGIPCVELSTKDAKQAFGRQLFDFLRARIEGARRLFSGGGNDSSDAVQKSGGGRPPGTIQNPGLSVTVHTHATQLQVLYSPAFFIRIQTVFGNTPSTPVPGYLNPGTYIFGAKGLLLPVTFEPQQYSIPPTFSVHTTTI